jgi:hypothetical protein
MPRWAAGLGLVGWCVLCSVGCRKAEPEAVVSAAFEPAAATEAPAEAPSARPTAFVELPEPSMQAPEPAPSRPEPPPEAPGEQHPSQLLETDSETRERPMAGRPSRGDDERVWLSEAAESARAGNTSISASEPVETITIATGTVEGRVKRVRPGTLEVSDEEGNVYELRIDGRSRGLRRGRHVPLKELTEGTPVRASFDLVGDGESRARDIVLHR